MPQTIQSPLQSPIIKPKVIALLGPTASGKTACALHLAAKLNAEIVSLDSALIYRGMDIGSAKPSLQERQQAPHHLIDIIEPEQSYSVAQFRQDALAAIAQIHARGRTALLVGGTMMYFNALVKGLDDLPAADPSLRARLDAEAAQHGLMHLYRRLEQLDPATAQRLKPGDSQRIQRALEVIELSGSRLSELLAKRAPNILPFDLIPFALEPFERSVLHQRIAERFDAMLGASDDAGLIAEVRNLRQRPGLHLGLPSMRCVGYRQAWEYLEHAYDRQTLREKGIAATRQLAKRQLTWLRAMPQRIVIDCLSQDPAQQILQMLENGVTGNASANNPGNN